MKNIAAKRAIMETTVYQGGRFAPGWLERLAGLDFRWREPLLIFGAWRFAMLLMPWLAALVLPPGTHGGTAPYHIVSYYEGTTGFWNDRLLAAWGRWDGEWYLQLANFGYTPPEGAPAFFPLYPLLIRLLGGFLLGNYMLAGVLISTMAALVAFIFFYNLTFCDFGDRQLARRALVNFAVFPTVFFLAAIYTEALFLAFTLTAFYCVRHWSSSYKWWVAGLLAGLAALTRNVGVLTIAALAWEWWRQERLSGLPGWLNLKPRAWRNLVGLVGLPVLAVGGWLAGLWLVFGDPLIFIKAQSSHFWQRQSATPWQSCWEAFTVLFSSRTFSDSNIYNFLTLVAWVLLMLGGMQLARQGRFPASYLIFMVITFLPGLTAPRPDQPLFALPRYLLVLFPLYQIVSLTLPQTGRWRWVYLGISVVFAAYFGMHFVQWGWVA